MLTLRQVDSIVYNTLLTFKEFEVKRHEEGTTVSYDIHEIHTSVKRFLGTYRVWEWHDGSSRCGWMPLNTNDAYILRMRNVVWEAITANTVPANLSSDEQDAS